MLRSIQSIIASSLLSLAIACGGSDETKTTSTSAGASPTVSASAGTPSSSEDPTSTALVSYETAEAAFTAGRYPEAANLFAAYTGTHPDNPWGHYMLGMAAWKTGEHEKAVSAFDQALSVDSSHQKSLLNSSRVLLEQEKPKEALQRIEKVLALEPASNEGHRLLGRAQYELDNADAAIEAYRRALAIDERDVWSMNNLGLIYIQQGRSEEAIPPLARAVELRSNSPVFQNNLGTALERSGYPTAAARAYEAAIAVDSTYVKAATGLARVTGGSQQPEPTGIDLTARSEEFQSRIETWRGTENTDSTAVPVAVPEVLSHDSAEVSSDSGEVSSQAVSDSFLVSGREVTDSVECTTEEDL
ncbi:MAG TPA: tetratricopeptide repeat protein [Gemmatimonadales bacterium]|nr:tetratricopeptide repeat protein [Gemmatimonadales bacterium]